VLSCTVLTNAICAPSGESAGHEFCSADLVSACCLLPSGSIE
jgi:hypothetical protein